MEIPPCIYPFCLTAKSTTDVPSVCPGSNSNLTSCPVTARNWSMPYSNSCLRNRFPGFVGKAARQLPRI